MSRVPFNLERRSRALQNLAQDQERLLAQISRTEQRMADLSDEWSKSGGICCPGCWSHEFRALDNRQERRHKHLNALVEKIVFKQEELEAGHYIPTYNRLLRERVDERKKKEAMDKYYADLDRKRRGQSTEERLRAFFAED